jgi:hypothetical protein
MYSRDNAVIIDIQFMHGKSKEYIIKELAILHANYVAAQYYLLKPPYAFCKLGKRAQYQNLYNERYIHNMAWYCGYIDYSKVKYILQPYQNYTIIVKGEEKKNILEKYLSGSTIISLAENFSLQDGPNFTHNCPHHESAFQRCAVNHVYKVRRYLENENLLV